MLSRAVVSSDRVGDNHQEDSFWCVLEDAPADSPQGLVASFCRVFAGAVPQGNLEIASTIVKYPPVHKESDSV